MPASLCSFAFFKRSAAKRRPLAVPADLFAFALGQNALLHETRKFLPSDPTADSNPASCKHLSVIFIRFFGRNADSLFVVRTMRAHVVRLITQNHLRILDRKSVV